MAPRPVIGRPSSCSTWAVSAAKVASGEPDGVPRTTVHAGRLESRVPGVSLYSVIGVMCRCMGLARRAWRVPRRGLRLVRVLHVGI